MTNGRLIYRRCTTLLTLLLLFASQAVYAQQNGKPEQLDSALIRANRGRKSLGNGGIYSPGEIRATVTTLGEPDILRHISSLPGVSQGMEGTLGLFVRGSNNGGNRITLNGVPIYSYSHLFGLISTINPDIVSETVFKSGGISADQGDLSSSLVEIRTKKAGETTPFNSIGISPYVISFAGSRRKDDCKSGTIVSARVSMLPFLVGKAVNLYQESSMAKTIINGFMYDLSIQGDRNLGEKNQIDYMVYSTEDRYQIGGSANRIRIGWWLAALKAGWKYDISEQLALDTRFYHIRSNSKQIQDLMETNIETSSSLQMINSRNETNISSVLKYGQNTSIHTEAGIEFSYKEYLPAACIVKDKQQTTDNKHIYSVIALAGFQSFTYLVPGFLNVSMGLREAAVCTNGEWRAALDIRAKGNLQVSDCIGLELTLDKLTQYHHVLEGLPAGWSLDITIPSYSDYPEEKTLQGYAGFCFNKELTGSNVRASAGGFYRNMKNLVSYRSSTNFFRITDATWANEVVSGNGRSYGLELAGAYNSKRVDANIAYTLSKTTRNFAEINEGKDFLFRYDRPHILNLNTDILLGSRKTRKGKTVSHNFNLSLAYSSGNLITMPASSYQGETLPFWELKGKGSYSLSILANRMARTRYEYGSENNYRMDDYLRLDIAYSIEKRIGTIVNCWTFSVFNVLNRHNPMLIYNNGKGYKSVSLVPIMPSIRWSCRF